ncbi:hypothetical protein AX774_g7308 [Zancudomyces culisetae]|uniref:Uncharacterized protein n=1 Tax=Zancudomyces culisetae TaxID=1213189 RepID=A0A1R1PE62_ZANCU|nr:hypothetical protein AX774_g7308 [Zancudomyces culisetae]|eukprot:OMH79285.1 hypothetical protein AX774_g7308 [Zancudomyces culisetae]
MSGLMHKLRLAWIQQAKDEGRYSSDSDRSGATNTKLGSSESHDTFKELADQTFLLMKNPITGEYQTVLAQQPVSFYFYFI